MSARRTVVVVAVGVSIAAMLTGGGALAGTTAAASHPSRARATVPAAARRAVSRAITTTGGGARIDGHELVDPHGRVNEYYGTAVAVSGDLLVVGAPGGYTSSAVGVVDVFRRPASGWAHVRKVATLTPSDGHAGDQFGDGVAVSGSTIVVGAGYRTIGTNSAQGAVYVFSEPAAGWHGTVHESAELIASDGHAVDYLGYEGVAISGRVVTSAGSYHEVGSNIAQGAVYVWVEPKAGWSGTRHESAELTASDGAGEDYLGYGAVAVSGRTVFAAAGYHQVGTAAKQGAVYAWEEPRAGWSGTRHESAELIARNGKAGDFLGYESLAVAGSTVVAGSGYHNVGDNRAQGELYVWQRPKAGWTGTLHENARLVASDGADGDYLGYAAASISGDTIFATAPDRSVGTNSDQGVGYLFSKPKHGWSGTRTQVAEMTDAHGADSDDLGTDNAAATSGTTDVAGASTRTVGSHTDQGAVVVFSPPRPTLTGLRQSHRSWRAASHRPALNPAHPPAHGGTRFAFALSEAGSVTMQFVKRGHPSVRRTLSFTAPVGHSALYFFGRLTGHVLTAGRYSVTASVANDAGTSTGHKLRFTLTTG